MRKLRVLGALLAVSLCFTLGISVYEIPEPSWQKTVLDNDTSARFVKAGTADGMVHVVYQKSDDEGVTHFSTKTDGSIVHNLGLFINGRSWSFMEVDSDRDAGTYLSLSDSNDQLKLAYQDATVGSEEVVYAEYSDSNWTVETVDSSGRSGANVGMYAAVTSFEGQPLVAYHSPRNGLETALKTEDGWQEYVIGGSSGWFTSAATCGTQAFISYSGRNSRQLNISSFDGEGWTVTQTDLRADHDTEMVQQGCKPITAFLNPSGNRIQVLDDDVSTVEISRFAVMGLERNNGYHISFGKYSEGVYYGYSDDKNNWTLEKIGANYQSGEHNDVTVDRSDNVHIFYSNATSLVHAENNSGRVSIITGFTSGLQNASLALNLLLAVVFVSVGYREDFFHLFKSFMIEEIEE